jgi:serine/threonine protein kinase/class 3 adenylate cyclase
MHLGRYRLLAQRGAGRDGIVYRGLTAEGDPVEIRVLTGARADVDRWRALTRRLHLAALLDHPSARRVHHLDLDHDPPYLALAWTEAQSLCQALGGRLPLALPEVAALAEELAAVLLAAHRLGLAHGQLGPSTVWRTSNRGLLLDFTGWGSATTELDASSRAPEPVVGEPADPSTDIFALGALLFWCSTGQALKRLVQDNLTLPTQLDSRLGRLLQAMVSTDPVERPSAREVVQRLRVPQPALEVTGLHGGLATGVVQGELGATVGDPSPIAAAAPELRAERLGRYRLLEKLGEGGMGTVYRAEDPADGSIVAIKVLRPESLRAPMAVRRLHKEARLLAEVNNPYVTNFLELNEDSGIHYLVLEYVAGQSLGKLLGESNRLDERTALAIAADVAHALADAHERGIVHRDIKPENILLQEDEGGRRKAEEEGSSFRVKLSDFGLARHIDESESLHLTQTGAIVGTPLYMAPEQGTGGAAIDARTDVYALGCTLFHLLAGRPPFLGETPFAVITQHAKEPPPPLQKLNPALSEGVCRIVEKCLAKSPDSRYPNAGALQRDLERLLRGEPTSIVVHPRLPPCDPHKVREYEFVWELEASPAQLWPFVSNTERLNRAAGLQPVVYETEVEEDAAAGSLRPRVRRFGKMREAGLTVGWEEHPFEWIEGQRLGVLREFRQGPIKWLLNVQELSPLAGGGTRLTHRVRLEPHGLIGRTAAAVKVGIQGRRALDRIYRRMDAALTGKLGSLSQVDLFEEPTELSGGRRRQLDALLDQLGAEGVSPAVVERLGDFVATAPDQEVSRIRPLALARRLALDPEQVVAACLHGSRLGLFVLLWDILCPVCRIPSEVKDTLKVLREHGRCDACNLDFELDFANSVEMIFRAHPALRETVLGTYCIGGPAHSPHVVAQVRVAAGERLELDLTLPEGAYRVRGPQLPFTLDCRTQPAAPTSELELRLAHGPDADTPRLLRTERQRFVLTNDHDTELVVRVERLASRADALTAARASALALFRELFPDEVLSPGQLVSVSTITLLVTALEGAGQLYAKLGDARAFSVIHEHFRLLDERIRREGGALVKTVGEGLLAVFREPVAAVRTAVDLPALLAQHETTRGLRLRLGVHQGPAMAATINDQLDYFGATVNRAAQLLPQAGGGDLLLTPSVAGDSQVAALLQNRGLECEVLAPAKEGAAFELLHRLRLAPESPTNAKKPPFPE